MTEDVDVLIIGAGLSGIGAAYNIQRVLPQRTYTILEARAAIGGTWDLFRYPGLRSDSDMHTLGYRFRPWTDAKAIADGPAILSYVRDTAAEAGIDRHIRFGHQVTSAEWSTQDARWIVRAVHNGRPVTFRARFLHSCTGYYRYDHGHEPEFAGSERFGGQIVHPQLWPEDLDYTGKRIVVIGSGATAITLIPALAKQAAHVTMLQRSPSYVAPRPGVDKVANRLARLLGPRLAYPATRWKNVLLGMVFFQITRRRPDLAKAMLRSAAVEQLPDGFDVNTHFTPRYNPWDQRLCMSPDGDFFAAIRDGNASVVTDQITEFTETGLALESGTHLDADIVVTATGLVLLAFGGIELSVDGRPVKPPETMVYKGTMVSGIPNFAFTMGYTTASWTLKADLVSEYAVRVLRHMAVHGYDQCVPTNDDPTLQQRPLVDFKAGYVKRSGHVFPKAGSRPPWRLGMNYAHDVLKLRYGRIEDGVLRFSRQPAPVPVYQETRVAS